MAEIFRCFGDIFCLLLSFSIVILTTAGYWLLGRISAVVRITIEKLSKIHKMSPKRRKKSVINFQKFNNLFFFSQRAQIIHIQLSLNPLTQGGPGPESHPVESGHEAGVSKSSFLCENSYFVLRLWFKCWDDVRSSYLWEIKFELFMSSSNQW